MLLRASVLCVALLGCTVPGTLVAPCPAVRVSEVMTGQQSYEPIESDWFELENVSGETIDLTGVRLQRPGAPPWPIPAGVTLVAGAWLVFLAAEQVDPEAEYLTTGFDFNKDSETLLVWAAGEDVECEEVRIPDSHDDFSWQRDPLGGEEWCFATEPSPNAENEDCLCTVVDGC